MEYKIIEKISKDIQNILAENNISIEKMDEVLALSSQYIKSRTTLKKIN